MGADVGGNIGAPLAQMDEKAPIWVLETSSFTIHYTKKAKPNIYLLLPITPDHVSWHGSMEAYEEAKLKPFSWMQEGEMIVAPAKCQKRPDERIFCRLRGCGGFGPSFSKSICQSSNLRECFYLTL